WVCHRAAAHRTRYPGAAAAAPQSSTVHHPMNPDLQRLLPYPFERLARLKAGVTPPAALTHINLSIGEPTHPPPHFVAEQLISHLHGLANYPLTRGSDALRAAMAAWLTRRFALPAG